MESRGNLSSVRRNETVSTSSRNSDKMHITAKGREGKALRKKLAIAMGLRISSSGTPSTIDSDEEIDLPEQEASSTNVMELFRKQMKETTAKKKNISSHQQVSNQANNEASRRTVFRRTTTTTREFLSDDDTDERERSMDRITRSANTRKSHDITRSQHLSEDSKINTQLTAQQETVTQSVSTNNDASPSEEIFSSYGEQDDSSAVIKTTADNHNSVKLLREKIRKNARARRLPTPKSGFIEGKETNLENGVERASSYQSIQRKNSGSFSQSQIPVRIETKTSETRAHKTNEEKETQENQVQILKTKIPRRNSQNAKDRKDSFKKNDSGFSESLLTEIFSTNKNERNSPKKTLDVQESRRVRNSNEDIVTMNASQELHSSESSSLFDSVSTEKVNKKSTPVPASEVKHILKDLRAREHNKSLSSRASSKTSSKKYSYNLDAILAELAELKESVFKTYDDLHEMNEYTQGLRKELKEMRNI